MRLVIVYDDDEGQQRRRWWLIGVALGFPLGVAAGLAAILLH